MTASADVAVVVLAGGSSRRFGSDKLATPYGATDLLTTVIASLAPVWAVVVVGPPRTVGREVDWVCEEPAGGGPAAALVTGIRSTAAPTVLTVPGDSPRAGRAAARLLTGLAEHERVVAYDDRPNPLWLGLRGAALDRVRAAEPADWVGRPARMLMRWIDPVELTVPPTWLADVDVPTDLSELSDL